MRLLDAALKVLRDNKKTMKVADIWSKIDEGNLYTGNGRTPLRTLQASILRHTKGLAIKNAYKKKYFYKDKKGTYGLLEWLTEEDVFNIEQREDEIEEIVSEEDERERGQAVSPDASLLDTGLFLEKEWHRWLYKNLESNNLCALGFGDLRLYDEEKQKHIMGKYNTNEIGEIDMLLINDSNEIIVIELKREGTDDTVGQVCRYVGWVKSKLSKGNNVYGIIIAQKINNKLRYAIMPIKDYIFYQQLEMKVEFGESSRISTAEDDE